MPRNNAVDCRRAQPERPGRARNLPCVSSSPRASGVARCPSPGKARFREARHLLHEDSPSDRRAAQGAAGWATLATILEADPSKEVAVLGAIWIAAPPIASIVAALRAIGDFEKGGNFSVTKRDQRARAHRGLRRPHAAATDDLADLAIVRGGRLRAEAGGGGAGTGQKEVNWKAPDAKRARWNGSCAHRRQLRHGVPRGREQRACGATATGSPYIHRERKFRELCRQCRSSAATLPGIRQYLLDFPKPDPRITDSFLLGGRRSSASSRRSASTTSPSRRKRCDGCRLQAALRQPLLLDGARTSRAGYLTPIAVPRLLVRERQPEPTERSSGF